MQSRSMQMVAMVTACFIVIAAWVAVVVLSVIFINRRTARIEREQPGVEPKDDELAFLYYALSIFFWPAAFILGVAFMREARTVRIGRICAILGLVDISVIVLLTCIGMVAVAAYAPELLP